GDWGEITRSASGLAPDADPLGNYLMAQRPLSSTRSTEPLAAGMVARPLRPGPTPSPERVTRGAPAEPPALTVTLDRVKGKRFSIFRVVLPVDRLATLVVTKPELTAWSRRRASEAPSSAETAEVSLKETWPRVVQSLASPRPFVDWTRTRPRVSPDWP